MPNAVSIENIRNALSTVQDPELHRDLVSLGMVETIDLQDNHVHIKINLTTPACPMKATIEKDVQNAVMALGVSSVRVAFGSTVRAGGQPALEGIQHIVVVGSGKGGVGKSSVAVNLAASLAASGAKVGLMDGDIYGPSVAHMLGESDARIRATADRKMIPLEKHGFKFVSMANLVAPGQALVWRGPMLHSAIQQFLRDVAWGELDYLIVDLPPGTGDVQLSLSTSARISGAVIVTTPQDVALIDASRAVDMFRKNNVPILGMVENMSYFVAPDTGVRYDIFGQGGAKAEAERLGLFFLGQIPLDIPAREAGDAGVPVVLSSPQGFAAQALLGIAGSLAGQISVQSLAVLPMV